MARVRVGRAFELEEDIGCESPRIADENQRPAPCDEPECNFEAARPVDADAWWVQAKPRQHRVDDGLRITPVAGQSPRLRQLNEPLMAIELPDHFAVTNRCAVERVHLAPMNEGSTPARNRIEVPIERIAELEIAISEEIESAGGGVMGGDQHRLTVIGVCALQRVGQMWIEWTFEEMFLAVIEKVTEAFPAELEIRLCCARQTDAIDEFGRLLPA